MGSDSSFLGSCPIDLRPANSVSDRMPCGWGETPPWSPYVKLSKSFKMNPFMQGLPINLTQNGVGSMYYFINHMLNLTMQSNLVKSRTCS